MNFKAGQSFDGSKLVVQRAGSMCALIAIVLSATLANAQSDRPPAAATQWEHLTQLLDSPHRGEVVYALDYLKQLPPQSSLTEKVRSLAERSPDSIVRGYARLLAADWRIRLAPALAELNRARQNPHLPIPPVQLATHADSTSANFSNTDFSNTNSSDTNLSERQNIADLIPAVEVTPQVQQTGLTPQTPFWAKDSLLENEMSDARGDHASVADSDVLPSDTKLKLSSIDESIRPQILDRSINAQADELLALPETQAGFFSYERDAPLGYTGASGVLQTEFQQSDHFVPIEDRWRLGFPKWDRYGKGHPAQDDYPYKEGSLFDPYNQNVLKGDFPIIGQHTFFNVTAESLTIHEFRQTPTATTPFESTNSPFSSGFFGNPNQIFYAPYFKVAFELFHGHEAFKPMDWKIRLQPVFNTNYLDVEELAVVNPDVRLGTNRLRDQFALEEYFIEAKLADIGPDYDFISARVGSQLFVSDFRGFVFRDINRGVRLFGTRLSNRDQFNAVWFDQVEKDTNSDLNTFDDRHQNVVVLNYFRQDFVIPGYTALASFHYNHDQPSFKFDQNDNLVRPDPVGVFKQHEVNAYYIGVGGDGHIGRINVSNQVYFALGNDSANPIGGTEQTINAQMAALELSYDRDWIRFRGSYFFASGDDDPNDGEAEGFDTILDDPIFAGGEFSYWQRQSIRLFGTNLVQRKSIVPNLRSSKTQGQSNFVNPGLHLFNIGTDIEVTPRSRIIANANYMFFDEVAVLETYTFQDKIQRSIGTDLSLGFEYRPLLNDNAIIVFGLATLIPGEGLEDLYGTELPQAIRDIGVGDQLKNERPRLTSTFLEVVLTY